MINYYQCLGLPNSATAAQVKVAYREFAMNYHPDKHGNSEFFKQRFQEIQQAYETLANTSSRAVYDSKYARFTNSTTNTSAAGDAAKLKDLTLKVSKLEASVKDKEQMLTSLVSKVKAKETECERLQKLNTDFSNQIGSLSSLITAESAKSKSVRHLAKSAVSLLAKKHPLVLSLIVASPVLLLLAFQITTSSTGNKSKLQLANEIASIDKLIHEDKYSEILTKTDNLIESSGLSDTTSAVYDGKRVEAVDLYMFRGYAKSKLGNQTGAIEDLNDAIGNRRTPSSQAYWMRAIIKWKIGRGAGFFADMNHALEIEPDFLDARIRRADAYYEVHKFTKAIEDYRVANKIEPNNASVLNSIGNCYYVMHQYNSACLIWNKASSLGSNESKNSLRFNCK